MANPGKRSAEASARFASNKKPRFDYRNPSTLAPDAPEDEDPVLDLDEVGKAGHRTKRNAVNLDGFESDSSTENFDLRAAERGAKPATSKDEEDMDMFADADENIAAGGGRDGDLDEDVERTGKKKKAVRFIDADDIEGADSRSKGGGHVSADLRLGGGKAVARDKDVESSSDSGDDEERAALDAEDEDAEEIGAGGKKKHAPKLDAFNMRAEEDDGKFDESGNFVRKATDPDALHDVWLDGLNKKDLKKAREAHEQREEARRKKNAEDDALVTSDLLATLIRHLEKGETVLEALQRLGSKKKQVKKVPKWKQKKTNGHADSMDVDQEAEDPTEARRREAVEAITGAADQLFSRDQQEIYDSEREALMRQYKRETGEDYIDQPADGHAQEANGGAKQWEYRWADTRDGGEPHGPYDGPTMEAWVEAGYFGEGVEYRPVGSSAWSAAAIFT